jgi:hypothetical protein
MSNPENRFGQIRSARMVVKGPICTPDLTGLKDKEAYSTCHLRKCSAIGTDQLWICWDQREAESRYEPRWTFYCSMEEFRVGCILIILRPTDDGQETYLRIGFFRADDEWWCESHTDFEAALGFEHREMVLV